MASDEVAAAPIREPSPKEIRLVIAASSAGTIFEWYDFFIYGTLAGIIGATFFPSGNETLSTLLVWAGFAVGFGFRPLGAILFGYLGDKLGRKYTFLVTVTLMGIATAGVGMIPSAATIGIAAPIIIISLRIIQGLALGGEYGGAAIYVAEHAPPEKRGFFTSFIQASVVGGFVLSLVVVLSTKLLMSDDVWNDWGWRVPFLLSIVLLIISLWMRFKLSESPVFQAMKAEGKTEGNPFVKSFTYPGNKKRIFVALFGVAAGLTVVWYTAMFSGLTFLKGPLRVENTTAEIIVGIAAFVGMIFFIMTGKWSDKVGRKKPFLIGLALTLVLLFPLFWLIGNVANPALTEATEKAPIVISAPECEYSPFSSEQDSECGKILSYLSGKGLPYERQQADSLQVTIGGMPVADTSPESMDKALTDSGYNFEKIVPTMSSTIIIILALLGLAGLSGLTYGSVAAMLAEMFPPEIRYSSMSIPYHFGAGYFGGFLPLIASYIIARTGDLYAGLWYTWGIVLMAFIITWWGLKESVGQKWTGKIEVDNLSDVTGFSSPLELHIDGDALVSNWRALDQLSGEASAGAAVKADGYGLGVEQVITRLSRAGCRDFFAATWEEAEKIEKLSDDIHISVLNGIGKGDTARAKHLRAKPVINSLHQAALWAETGLPCDLMVNSGMNRLGIDPEELDTDILKKLKIDILMSHLASADEDVEQNTDQLKTFTAVLGKLPAKRTSMANSAGIVLGPDYHFDLTRPGLSLYGGKPRRELQDPIKQVVFPKAQILQRREVLAGAKIGYNATFAAPKDMVIAILAIGYADGYLRSFSETGHFWHDDVKLPAIGRVSMDLVAIDIGSADHLGEGDWVDCEYDLPVAARQSGLSQYELLTGLGKRYHRVWR